MRDGEQGPVREYVLVPGADPTGRGGWPTAPRRRASRCGCPRREARRETAPSRRAFVVPLAQPAGRLVRNLLDPHVSMDEAFVKEQERRRKKRLDNEIYDVTGWSLPLAFDVECVRPGRLALGGELRPSDATPPPPRRAAATAKVA